MGLGARLQAHVSPASMQNPQPVEIPSASPQPAPPSFTQEAAPSLLRIKDPLAGATEQYRDVLPLFLAGMFTVLAGRPKTIKGGK